MGQENVITDSFPANPTIVYDGDCPFCSRYVTLLRLNEALGPVDLLNARHGGALVTEIYRCGLDLDQGMVLILNGELYHGADCMHRLALLTTPSDAFNRLNVWIFRSRVSSNVFYPMLRLTRNVVLAALGRRKLGKS
jgi:predicted DCC family thiol-disulfide oxidoreductase YuxK